LRASLTEGLKKDFAANAPSDVWDTEPQADTDSIDAALASEALVNLDQTLARIVTLDEMTVGPEVTRGAEYFEEAHRCDLLDLKIAAAVLCRAMLEAALIQVIDRNGRISAAYDRKKSYIGAMLDEAAKLHLDPERHAAAREIHRAGDAAIHRLPEFKRQYAPRTREIVDNTRKVIIDLYQ
jgi:hypothetical protein